MQKGSKFRRPAIAEGYVRASGSKVRARGRGLLFTPRGLNSLLSALGSLGHWGRIGFIGFLCFRKEMGGKGGSRELERPVKGFLG